MPAARNFKPADGLILHWQYRSFVLLVFEKTSTYTIKAGSTTIWEEVLSFNSQVGILMSIVFAYKDLYYVLLRAIHQKLPPSLDLECEQCKFNATMRRSRGPASLQ